MDNEPGSRTLEESFLASRAPLLRFLIARGAGDAAEDLLHELWLRIAAAAPMAVDAPLPYMMRAANRLMIDRHRSLTQSGQRERSWGAVQPGVAEGASAMPSSERLLIGRQHAAMVEEALAGLGERPAAIFRRHRIDEVPQRAVAEEFGVSLSTVESDLRRAYRVLAEVKERIDEA